MSRPNLAVFVTAVLMIALPSAARGDERTRLADPTGLRAREEVAVAPPPAPPPAPTVEPIAPVASRAVRRVVVAAPPTRRAVVAAPPTRRAVVAAPVRPAVVPAPRPAVVPAPRAARNADAPRAARNADAPRAARATAAPRRVRRPPPPCLSPTVELVRVEGHTRESQRVSLMFCDGRAVPAALDTISVLSRPHGVDAPDARTLRAYARRLARRPRRGEAAADPAYVVDGVLRVAAGLVPRLAKIAERFAGKPIEIVSGWRPTERASSRHHHGRAIDLRVRGVSREALRDFARSLDETGVGYYPNSVFVHVDVRERRAYWVDRSGPGEEADYGAWPPPAEEQLRTRDRILANAMAALDSLRVEVPEPGGEPALDGAQLRAEDGRAVHGGAPDSAPESAPPDDVAPERTQPESAQLTFSRF